jgi:hypothetical protein
MMSESNRMFVAGGLLVGALALTALGLRFGNRESSANEANAPVDSAVSSAARPVTPDVPLDDDARNAGIERVLQAVHDSLQRGDLASARVLLDAVLTMRADEPQALLLQKELAVREEQAKTRAMLTTTLDEQDAKPVAQPGPSAKKMSARPGKSHRPAQKRDAEETAIHASTTAAIRPNSTSDDAAPASHAIVAASPLPNSQPETPIAPTMQTAATNDPPVEPAAPPTARISEPAAPSPAIATGAPKTRAEVRDELNRARKNGTMSRFGNPDPYGPGGSPSYNAQPSIRTW